MSYENLFTVGARRARRLKSGGFECEAEGGYLDLAVNRDDKSLHVFFTYAFGATPQMDIEYGDDLEVTEQTLGSQRYLCFRSTITQQYHHFCLQGTDVNRDVVMEVNNILEKRKYDKENTSNTVVAGAEGILAADATTSQAGMERQTTKSRHPAQNTGTNPAMIEVEQSLRKMSESENYDFIRNLGRMSGEFQLLEVHIKKSHPVDCFGPLTEMSLEVLRQTFRETLEQHQLPANYDLCAEVKPSLIVAMLANGYVQEHVHILLPHGMPLLKTKAELESSVDSVTFHTHMQALLLALCRRDLGRAMAQMSLPDQVVAAASSGDLVRFLDAVKDL